MRQELLDRFFRYVKMDTQSQEDVEDRYPSTEKQKVLCSLLAEELRELGLCDARMDEYGYVTATYPSNLPDDETAHVPVIGLLGHVDTSPEVSGKDVKPILHRNYQGGDIVLPGDVTQIIREEENPNLHDYIGEDIVTSDGTTLLGADNKAGVAEIMTFLSTLNNRPEIPHGTLRICFTPDEEVGRGTEHFDVKDFGADYAYTVDGGRAGDVENETFNAAVAVFTITGINVHPGYAKDKLINSCRMAAEIVAEIKDDPSPETTEDRQGFFHPYVMNGGVERTVLKILLRDFEVKGIEGMQKRLGDIQKKLQQKYPKAGIDLEIKHQYPNMRFELDREPRVVEYALEAVRRVGLEPRLQIIRGGTDGAVLGQRGLLTPNIFTGGMNFHSKLEWIPVRAMEKAVDTLLHLVQIWVEKSVE